MIINLKNTNPIAKGSSRICYEHPDFSDRCIKVSLLDNNEESIKEKNYYKYLENKGISWEYIAKYHNTIKTDIGDGFVYDLVRDYDGNISKTLSYYLQTEEKTKSIINPLILLNEIKHYLLRENIMVKDFNTKNMMYQKTAKDTARLIIVDGLHKDKIISLSMYIKYFSLKKITTRYDNFENSLYKRYHFNKYFINLLKDFQITAEQ